MTQAYFKLQPTGTIIQTDSPHLWADPNAKRLPTAKGKAMLAEESRARLLEILKPGDTVQCVLRHVSHSGMYRVIDFYTTEGGDLRYLSGLMLNLGIGERSRGRQEGVGMSGCGMDMGFAAVYELGYRLWPEGTEKPHGTRNGQPDSNGGYALKHRWLTAW